MRKNKMIFSSLIVILCIIIINILTVRSFANKVTQNVNYINNSYNESVNQELKNEDNINNKLNNNSMLSENILSEDVEKENNEENRKNNKETIEEIKKSNVMYSTHIQNLGWEYDFSKNNGEISGTEGKSLRLEAIKIKTENFAENVKIKYQVHIQNIGWQGWKENGQIAGTQGKNLRLEAIRIKLENEEKYSVEYRVHIQNVGWQKWKQDGAMAGTIGKALRLEAIQIRIIDKETKGEIVVETNLNDKTYFDRINVSGYKTSNIKNTQIKVYLNDEDFTNKVNLKYTNRNDIEDKIDYGSETENSKPGFTFSIDTSNIEEGKHNLKIELVTEDEKTILNSQIRTINIDKNIHIEYKSHVQDEGWQNYVSDGTTSGTMGKSRRIEALKIKAHNLPEGVKIKFQAHVQDEGWQKWKNEEETIGTTGKSRRIEGLKIKLENTDKYSVIYRAHVQDYGWQDWANDGEMSGTVGEAKRIEAIQIKIVDKITKKRTRVYLDDVGTVTNDVNEVTGWLMTNEPNVKLKLFIDNSQISVSLKRKRDQGIYNQIKGYGGEELNPQPRFSVNIDFSKYSLGNHTIKVQAILKSGSVIQESSRTINIIKKIEHYKDRYGFTGLNDNLEYFRYGNGPNVFFATFCVHGFEDNWSHDGYELVDIAHQFYNKLVELNDYGIADKWTIYIMQCVNPDGVNSGYTNNGPGRTTVKSDIGTGIDLNRCWSEGFVANYSSRNYTGSSPFLAVESRYLRDFMLSHRSTNGQNIVVDLHGWTQQLIGDPVLRNYYRTQFPENTDTASYGRGFLINWARVNLGARAALIELPTNNYSHNDVVNHNLANRYIEATLNMLRNI